MLKMMEEVRQEGITQEELSWAKSSITNNFIFEFSSAAQIVSRKIAFAYDKLPQEFLETYRQRIAAVTPEEVQGVAERYLHPDRMVILVVGKGGRFDRPLSEFGEVTTLSLEEPL
jgi:predicted Zn-dependent peptidase